MKEAKYFHVNIIFLDGVSIFLNNRLEYYFSERYCFLFLLNVVLKGNGYTFRGDNSLKIVFLPSEKGFTLKGKNLYPFWVKFFPFRVDHFQCAGKQTGSHKSCLPCKNWQKIYQVYPVSLTV